MKTLTEVEEKNKCDYCHNEWIDIIEDENLRKCKVCKNCFEWMVNRLTPGTQEYKIRIEEENSPLGKKLKEFTNFLTSL